MKFSKPPLLILLLLLGASFVPEKQSFEQTQKNFDRVKDTYDRKEELIKMKCRSLDIPEETFGNVLIRVFKMESIMEMWVQRPDGKYVKFKQFDIYAMSGLLGPKRQQGDKQVPEGFYYINEFNPQSNYYLSLGINYPNESDVKSSAAERRVCPGTAKLWGTTKRSNNASILSSNAPTIARVTRSACDFLVASRGVATVAMTTLPRAITPATR